jgi:hypothetical protein
MEYIIVYLKMSRGERFCISKMDPTANEVDFFFQLRVGGEYTFPDVFLEWRQDGVGNSSAN